MIDQDLRMVISIEMRGYRYKLSAMMRVVLRKLATRVTPGLLALAAIAVAAERPPVDLLLVQACDSSNSVVPREWRLELDGIAAAFRDREVLDAIKSGPRRRIAVALLVWADAEIPTETSDWFVIDSAESAEAFARLVEQFPRRPEGGTGIGSGIAEAVRMIRRSSFDAPRSVIDVSGDGSETPPRIPAVRLPEALSMANALGATINGLAIVNEEPDIEAYYREHVVTGPDNFVIVADDYETFARAYRLKLLREITATVSNLGVDRLNMLRLALRPDRTSSDGRSSRRSAFAIVRRGS